MSSKQLTIKPSAIEDLLSSAIYYDEIDPQLSKDFREEIYSGFSHIEKYPEASPIVFEELRQYVVSRFPFRIFYLMSETEIEVFAVLHQSREFREILRER